MIETRKSREVLTISAPLSYSSGAVPCSRLLAVPATGRRCFSTCQKLISTTPGPRTLNSMSCPIKPISTPGSCSSSIEHAQPLVSSSIECCLRIYIFIPVSRCIRPLNYHHISLCWNPQERFFQERGRSQPTPSHLVPRVR